jgi:Tfp pilus assembly protein PilF
MDRALKLDGHDVRAAEYKCALEGISDSASAVPDCEATVRQNPSAESYLALAGTEQAQGDDTRAYANVSRSIDMSGSDLAYALPGSMAQRQGNTSQAQRDFTQAVQTALATR